MLRAPLPHCFYERDPVTVARELLGKCLVCSHGRHVTAGRIVEVEAYLARGDEACHAFRGRTRRNDSMFGPAGRAYVYSIHARYCLNAVTETEGVPSAVLIRAVEPLDGIRLMERRRGTTAALDLARGPARLCEAFGIDRSLDGWDLTRGRRLWIARGDGSEPPPIAASPRVGVTSAHELPLRFYVPDNRFVSRVPSRKNTHTKPWYE
ncbi:MAG TPA: DNA-3-methyladenine glycosylase [Planctomycetaceae bacterium]|nr:DNA-3-methyladenine glycosylase [Planctomycetaceae bacterium]